MNICMFKNLVCSFMLMFIYLKRERERTIIEPCLYIKNKLSKIFARILL